MAYSNLSVNRAPSLLKDSAAEEDRSTISISGVGGTFEEVTTVRLPFDHNSEAENDQKKSGRRLVSSGQSKNPHPPHEIPGPEADEHLWGHLIGHHPQERELPDNLGSVSTKIIS